MLVELPQPPTIGMSVVVAARTPGMVWNRCSSSS